MDYKKRNTGANWGGYLGSKAGEYIGGAAQRAFSAITGFGDYSVKQNVFATGSLPQVMNDPGAGGTVIRFQEYLGDIVTSAVANDFNIQEFILNVANEQTFPWVSQLAANYEQYEMQGLLFQFRSTSANALNSTNTALGSVMMATQYDVMDTPFASKGEMLNYEFSTSCKPSENCMHMIECAPKQTTISQLYTLNGPVPTGADPRLYHLGRFHVATTGFQGQSVNIGELHVTYQIKLLKPKLFASLGLLIDEYSLLASGANGYTSALPTGNPAASTYEVKDSLGITNDGNIITFAPTSMKKAYRVTFNWTGTGAEILSYPTINFDNCSLISASNIVSPPSTTTSAGANYVFSIMTAGNNLAPSIELSAGGLLPDASGGGVLFLKIIQENPDIV